MRDNKISTFSSWILMRNECRENKQKLAKAHCIVSGDRLRKKGKSKKERT